MLPGRPRVDPPAGDGRRAASACTHLSQRRERHVTPSELGWTAVTVSASSARSRLPDDVVDRASFRTWQLRELPARRQDRPAREPARHARVPRLAGRGERGARSPRRSGRAVVRFRGTASPAPPRLPRDAERGDAHLRRRGRPRDGRSPGGSTARSRRSGSTGARTRPWLAHLTVLRFRDRPAASEPARSRSSARSCRPMPLFSFPGCARRAQSTRLSKLSL